MLVSGNKTPDLLVKQRYLEESRGPSMSLCPGSCRQEFKQQRFTDLVELDFGNVTSASVRLKPEPLTEEGPAVLIRGETSLPPTSVAALTQRTEGATSGGISFESGLPGSSLVSGSLSGTSPVNSLDLETVLRKNRSRVRILQGLCATQIGLGVATVISGFNPGAFCLSGLLGFFTMSMLPGLPRRAEAELHSGINHFQAADKATERRHAELAFYGLPEPMLWGTTRTPKIPTPLSSQEVKQRLEELAIPDHRSLTLLLARWGEQARPAVLVAGSSQVSLNSDSVQIGKLQIPLSDILDLR